MYQKICSFLKKIDWPIVIAFLVLVAFACFLRFRLLDIKLLWYDEYFTEQQCFYSWPKIWSVYGCRRNLVFVVMMKLYEMLIHSFNPVNYMTEFQLRFPNALIGVITIIVIFEGCRRLKDKYAGLIATALAVFSGYLVHYSRDARSYTLLFVFSILLVAAGMLILERRSKGEKAFKNYWLYFCIATLGMYLHSSFWMLYAISNVFLVIYDISNLFFGKDNESLLRKIRDLIARTAILAAPLIFAIPLFLQLSTEPERAIVSKGRALLENINYSYINLYSMEYWECTPFPNYMLLIITLMAFVLIVFCKKRRVIIYLTCIKFAPFLIALILPRNIIKEELHFRYLIYIYCADILLVSFFCSFLIETLEKVLSKISFLKKNKVPYIFSTLLCLSLVLLIGCCNYKKILKSAYYEPEYELQALLDKLYEIQKDNDLLLTDSKTLAKCVPYFKKRGKISGLKSVRIPFLNDDKKLPTNHFDRILFAVDGEINDYPSVIKLGRKRKHTFAAIEIQNALTPRFVKGVTALVVNKSNDISFPSTDKALSDWRTRYASDAIKKYLYNEKEYLTGKNNLIKNWDFNQGLNDWKVGSNAEKYVKVMKDDESSFLSVNTFGTQKQWFHIRQIIEANVTSGEFYTISASIRNPSKNVNENSEAVMAISSIGKDKKEIDLKCYPIKRYLLKPEWIEIKRTMQFTSEGKMSFRLQFHNDVQFDIKNISIDVEK